MRKIIICKKCGETKPHGAFGLCKKCWSKQHYINNKEKMKQNRRNYYISNFYHNLHDVLKDFYYNGDCEFVPLCVSCHSKTNHNRQYYEDLIMCYLYPNRYFMIDL